MSNWPSDETLYKDFAREVREAFSQAVHQVGLSSHSISTTFEDFGLLVGLEWTNQDGLNCSVGAAIGMSHELPVPHVQHIRKRAWFTDDQEEVHAKRSSMDDFATAQDYLITAFAAAIQECNGWSKTEILTDRDLADQDEYQLLS